MTRFSNEIWVDAPHETVWAKIADLGAIQDYNPGVSKSYYTSSAREGVGASRHCDLIPFGEVEERIIEWSDGDSYAIEILNGKRVPPFKRAIGRLSATPEGAGTRVRFDIEYDLKFGMLGALLDRLMVRRQFRRVGPSMLRGLKRFLESGEGASSHSSTRKEAVNV